ncbi:hypothetical protein [Methanothrix sp.]|jgi:hypothetical protein|uniref:hypothetical protein n=1 Tax=Methanothrix sp. TaxID=90426 RepID=UPI003BB4B312
MRYIVVLRGTNVIGAKDSAFILLRLRRNSPGFTVRETTLKDGDFPLRPSQSYKLNREEFFICYMTAPMRGALYNQR